MLTRLAELLEAWDLDPRHPIALFVSGSSEILPEVPDPLAEAEGLRERVEDLEVDLDEAEARADEAEARADKAEARAASVVGDLRGKVAGLEAEVESLRAQVALLCEGDPTGRLAAEARAETDRVKAETDRVKAAHRDLLDQIARSAESAATSLARKGARKEAALRSLRWIQSAAKGG